LRRPRPRPLRHAARTRLADAYPGWRVPTRHALTCP
jgi:hypothetical protein